jgi:hypothetical protein
MLSDVLEIKVVEMSVNITCEDGLCELDASFLLRRGIHTLEVIVPEVVGQEATFRMAISGSGTKVSVCSFIRDFNRQPSPCPSCQSHDT